MKFGKNLIKAAQISDPEWAPYWVNYKMLKAKIKRIVEVCGGQLISDPALAANPRVLSKSEAEVEFFKAVWAELKKINCFFSSVQELYKLRYHRLLEGYKAMKSPQKSGRTSQDHEKGRWTRLLAACANFYKDVISLENFAVMNYCGFSKILKKHDKHTGFKTREAFMRNVMSKQEITKYPIVIDLLKKSEEMFVEIQGMERCVDVSSAMNINARTSIHTRL
jgi:SPX domain protein involved in polyphosphate accumulation